MELSVNVAEVKGYIKELIEAPGKFFSMIRYNVRESVGQYLSELMEAELTFYIGRERYERRGGGEVNYRNGGYNRRFTLKGIGEVVVNVPRDRKGKYKTDVLPRSRQYEDQIREDMGLMYLTGVSTRTLSLISHRLLGRSLSHNEVSKANLALTEGVEKWRNRDLSKELVKYMYLDGVNFDMRIGGSVEKVAVLVAIGVTEGGQKLVLGLQSGDKESASCWREFIRDLKGRGLDGSKVKLGIMDGLAGLEKVFQEEFSGAKTQRCQVHVARNVLAKVTKKHKKEVADDLRSIFYASSKEKAVTFYDKFRNDWQKEFPSAVKSLESSIDSCLTFFSFPAEEWISLRTTNIIERLNKEFKRRTKPMEIVAGENSCYRLLAFISLKMELAWRTAPVGKVNDNLPFFKQIAEKEFTQNC
ncbi:MAG TPA: IS256 family transposase [Candidatus Wunengus sp. YC61]|uniref:IS256 family transposase n=1 Tax=Candidatus Wunengus sp. YC61 TaxID=3367698 RepID=UPI00402959E3